MRHSCKIVENLVNIHYNILNAGNSLPISVLRTIFYERYKEDNMRLITRSDFDGLACGTLLKEAGIIDHWKFAHPKDLQDGLVEVTEDDCLANVPFVEGCGLWFDHHSSEHERLQLEGKYKGESRITPSCARIIYEYYGGRERFPQFDDMMEAVDKVDSGNLTIDEIQNPKGWILVEIGRAHV